MQDSPARPGQPETFGTRLTAAVLARGPLCAGIDPHPGLLRDWDLADDAGGLERFALSAVETLAPEVALVKPQSAFFERHGARGVAVLERVLVLARQAGALVLLDVKRGDIGSTMTGYAQAFLSDAAPLGADAITVSPYLGVGALEPAFELARETGRGVFVVALSSNPEGTEVQAACTTTGRTVAQAVVDAVATRNRGQHPVGDIGVVAGVVTGASAVAGTLQLDSLNGPVLAPGLGAQGATLADLARAFGGVGRHVLPTTSRDLLRHGPAPAALRRAVRGLADQASAQFLDSSWQVERAPRVERWAVRGIRSPHHPHHP